MLVVTIAVITGFFIGQILDRLTSGIVLSIQKKETPDEIGAFSFCQNTRYTRTLPCSDNDVFRCVKRSVWSVLVNSPCVKCRTGKTAAISLISALLSGIVIWHTGVTFAGLAALLCLHFLILLGFTDSETGYLSDCLTFPFLWTGLLVNINATYVPLHIAVISAAAAYLVCWLANRSFRYISGNDGMG